MPISSVKIGSHANRMKPLEKLCFANFLRKEMGHDDYQISRGLCMRTMILFRMGWRLRGNDFIIHPPFSIIKHQTKYNGIKANGDSNEGTLSAHLPCCFHALINSKQISCIDLILYIIQMVIISVGNNCIGLRFESI